MRDILIIMKKELRRFFTDRRLLLSLLLPGILIYVVYSLMGSVMGDAFGEDETYVPRICVIGETDAFRTAMNTVGFAYTEANYETAEQAREDLKNKNIDLVVEYEPDFAAKKAAHEADETAPAPTITITGYSTENHSSSAAATVSAVLSMSASVVTERTFYTVVNEDLATQEDTSMMIVSMIMPMLLMMLLFSGCMAVATESIAGEKERGTIATLLITPVPRGSIAIGKILALSITALFSSVVSFVAVLAALPKLMGGDSTDMVDLSIYGAGTYLGIFAVIVITVLVFTVLLSVLSTLAKSVKEASQYALPVMMLVMLMGIASMFGGQIGGLWPYFIPIFNAATCMAGLFSKTFTAAGFAITLGVNAACVALGVFALTKLFGNEKVMFNK